jgi:uncharacterized protein (TIGR02186 family)
VRRALLLACLGGALLARPGGGAAPQGEGVLRVEPSREETGVFYRGARLTVSAAVDSATAVAVLVSGDAGDLHLRTKVRTWGAFWAPAGHVTFTHVPEVYALATSAALEDLAPTALRAALGIGYDSFRPDSTQRSAREFFPELIRLREAERLFQFSPGTLRLEPAGAGGGFVTAAVALPARTPAATYHVQVFGFRDGRLVVHREGAFTLAQGAFSAAVDALAHERPLLYGIVAVVLAVGAGLLVGLAFGSVKGH